MPVFPRTESPTESKTERHSHDTSPGPTPVDETMQPTATYVPDLLVVGHATRDLLPSGDWRLGGSVTYAALTAVRLGLRPAIVTSGTPQLQAALREVLPDPVPLAMVPSSTDTTFENRYADGSRRQHLRGTARPLTFAHV